MGNLFDRDKTRIYDWNRGFRQSTGMGLTLIRKMRNMITCVLCAKESMERKPRFTLLGDLSGRRKGRYAFRLLRLQAEA